MERDNKLTRRDLFRSVAALAITESLHGAAQSVPGPIVKVEWVQGVPTFTLNGQPYILPVFETYTPEVKYFRQFAEVGTKVFSFNTNPGRCDYHFSSPTWPAPDRWDYSELDERAHYVLTACPSGLILPRVYVGTPNWWLQQHPEELEVLDDGCIVPAAGTLPTAPQNRPFPSIVSRRWREEIGSGLKHLIDHIQDSDYGDRIFGYFVTGMRTEEWYYWYVGGTQLAGYSKPTTAAFRAWLKRKYGAVENLRAAWRNATVTFESAPVPSKAERWDLGQVTLRDPARKMNVIDFYFFYNEAVPDTIDYFAGIIKRATAGTKPVGGFYAYMYEHQGDPENGHNALAKYLASPNLDFVFVTGSYQNRVLATGGENLRAPTRSVMLHGKLWYHDNDCGSYVYTRRVKEQLAKPQVSHADDECNSVESCNRWLTELGSTETLAETIWMYRRNAGFALCMGMFESYFDLMGGQYDAPDLMNEVSVLNAMFQRAKNYDRRPNSEILVIADESSCAYCSFRSQMLRSTVQETQWYLIKIGAPADHILLDDLPLVQIDSYKLVVFLNTYNVTEEQRDLIERKIKGGNRVVLWAYAPGLFSGSQSSPKLMQHLSGIQIVPSANETYIAPQIDLAHSHSPLAVALQRAGLSKMGPREPQCKLFSVRDSNAETLGTLPGSTAATLVLKDMGSWKSVYTVTPVLPPAFYRELARCAGVHIYNEQDDTFYANRTYITLHANGTGPRIMRFPRPCRLWDAVTEKQLASAATEYAYEFKNGETIILRYA